MRLYNFYKPSYRWGIAFIVFSLFSTSVLAQKTYTINGLVNDAEKQPLVGVNVFVEGAYIGATTDENGEFVLKILDSDLGRKLVCTFVGFYSHETILEVSSLFQDRLVIELLAKDVMSEEITIAASRIPERILSAPTTIELILNDQLKNKNTTELYNKLAHYKGVDVNSSSMLTASLSTRGFNQARSERMVQMVDFADTQSPGLGLNFGNMFGISELDIYSIELSHGPSSALYGADGFNGIINVRSKDPFLHEGLAFNAKVGTNNLIQLQGRYAEKYNNFLAFKINASIFSAKEWIPENYNPQSNDFYNNDANSNWGYNAVNVYGDIGENIQLQDYGIPIDTSVTLYLPGWSEKDLLADDDNTFLFRLNPSVSYLITNKLKATLDYRIALGTTTLQSSSRMRIKNFNYSQLKGEVAGESGFVRFFHSRDNANKTYDLSLLGNKMQRFPTSGLQTSNGTNVINYAQLYQTTFIEILKEELEINNSTLDAASQLAKIEADKTVLKGGEFGFNELRKSVLRSTGNASIVEIPIASNLTEFSAQYQVPLNADIANLKAGMVYRQANLGSEGRFFKDLDEEKISNNRYALYLQAFKGVLNDKIKLAASLRLEDYKNYSATLSPRFSAVYSKGEQREHSFRFSFGHAYRSPSNLNQYLYFDAGNVFLVGNLEGGFRGYNSQAIADLYQKGRGLTDEDIIEIEPLELEKVNSWELGYKSILNKKISLDANVYASHYSNFIGSVRFWGNPDGNLPDMVEDEGRLMQTWVNNDQTVSNFGFNIGGQYNWRKPLGFSLNYAYNSITSFANFQTFFNTPKNKFNLGLFGEPLNNLNYSLNFRMIDGFLYESAFAIGEIESYATLDFSLFYKVPKWNNMTLQFIGNNLTNANNVQIFGAPSIGRMLILGLMFDVE